MIRTAHPADTPTLRGCEQADVVGGCPFPARWRLTWNCAVKPVYLYLCNGHSDSYATCDKAEILEIDR